MSSAAPGPNSRVVYICGPMAGKPELNAEEFTRAAAIIIGRGDVPRVPHDLSPYKHPGRECALVYGTKGAEGEHDGGCYLRGDIAVMVMCDSIYRLPGWFYSRGARIESEIAGQLLIPIEDAVCCCGQSEVYRDTQPGEPEIVHRVGRPCYIKTATQPDPPPEARPTVDRAGNPL